MNIDELIDRFVERINSSPREGLFDEDVPSELRISRDAGGWWDWHVKATHGINWIEPLEANLGIRFPPSFRSLVKRYQFPAFEVGPLTLLANTSIGVYDELRDCIFRDEILSQCLLQSGLIQFAIPATGAYDPICFDLVAPHQMASSPFFGWIMRQYSATIRSLSSMKSQSHSLSLSRKTEANRHAKKETDKAASQ